MTSKKPKQWTSWRVCPNCGSRATKIFDISSKDNPLECQICGHKYNPPPQIAFSLRGGTRG